MFETIRRQRAARAVWQATFTGLTVGLVLLLPQLATAQGTVPFTAEYQGSFLILFGTGPDGTDELRFSGDGIALHLGLSGVDGYTTTRPSPTNPLCSDIVTDQVTLTAANGDELRLVNAGQDCLDFSVPGHIFIRGSGTFTVVGGTGRFKGATGSGTFDVLAEVTGFMPGGVSGSFALRFEGRITSPGG